MTRIWIAISSTLCLHHDHQMQLSSSFFFTILSILHESVPQGVHSHGISTRSSWFITQGTHRGYLREKWEKVPRVNHSRPGRPRVASRVYTTPWFLRKMLGTWSWTRELLHGSYVPSRGRLAACVCIADFLLLPFRMCMHEELSSLELLLA